MSNYAPQAAEYELDGGTSEEVTTAIGILNSIVRGADRINPRLAHSLSKKQERRVAAMVAAMQACRRATADYVVAEVYAMLEAAETYDEFKAAFLERAPDDPRIQAAAGD